MHVYTKIHGDSKEKVKQLSIFYNKFLIKHMYMLDLNAHKACI